MRFDKRVGDPRYTTIIEQYAEPQLLKVRLLTKMEAQADLPFSYHLAGFDQKPIADKTRIANRLQSLENDLQ